MAEAGSFAEKVKQQADIVRIVGDYVRLKKGGQNYVGLCPFHSEKTPSFAVHPLKQIYHCFGCGVGGDVFSFVMAIEKCEFPEAVKIVAEKSGIPVPKRSPRTPEEARATRLRTSLYEMHQLAATFFRRQLADSDEGRIAAAYLKDRGLDREAIERFGIGYAPGGGDALLRALKDKFPPPMLEPSGLFSKDQSGRMFDRFRRRIMFPIGDVSGKVIAFGGRAIGDDLPKYLNSPETPIYSKSGVLYHYHAAKEAMRTRDFAVLVEGYMDAIAVARAGVVNVVASCGTSLTESQAGLIKRFTRRCVVNYDPDSAGQAATERSITLLLEQEFDVRVLALPPVNGKNADPDLFVRQQGAEAYQKLLAEAPEFLKYLIERVRKQDLSSAEGKMRAVNFLLPYVQRMPNRLLRSEWATRISAELRIEEPVLRESLRKAAAERRDKVQARPELISSSVKPAERRLIQMLIDADDFRAALAHALMNDADAATAIAQLETARIFSALLPLAANGVRPDPAKIAEGLEEKDRRLLYDIAFEQAAPPAWDEAESCLAVLRRRQVEAQLAEVQRRIAANPAGEELRTLLTEKQELHRKLADLPQ